MRRPIRYLAAGLVALVVSGCVQAGVTRLDLTPRSSLAPEEVTVYLAEQQPEFDPSEYLVVAQINITAAEAASWDKVVHRCRSEAAKLGAAFVVVATGYADAGTVGTVIGGGRIATVQSYSMTMKAATAYAIARR